MTSLAIIISTSR